MITAFQANNMRLDSLANVSIPARLMRRLDRKIRRASSRCQSQTSIRFFMPFRSQDYVNRVAEKLSSWLKDLGYTSWQSEPCVLQVNWKYDKYNV